MKESIKKPVLLIVLLIAIVLAIVYLESTKVEISSIEDREFFVIPSREGEKATAPELVGTQEWINSEPLTIAGLRGKVVIVDFWTYSCINCIRTFPHLKEWHEKYSDKGLVIIGVHTPEFKFEESYQNVLDAVERHEIPYAVVQDNDYATWRAYQNRYWPRKYLIDANGDIRYNYIGEGRYAEIERRIQELLQEGGMDIAGVAAIEEEKEIIVVRKPLTPELYAGYDFALTRGQNIGNAGGMQPGMSVDYPLPEKLREDKIYLLGEWLSNKESLEALGESSIVLLFSAASVNIVADGDIEMEVRIDGEYVSAAQAGDDVVFTDGRAFVTVDGPRLYNVIRGEHRRHRLTLTVSKAFTFNAFTFG